MVLDEPTNGPGHGDPGPPVRKCCRDYAGTLILVSHEPRLPGPSGDLDDRGRGRGADRRICWRATTTICASARGPGGGETGTAKAPPRRPRRTSRATASPSSSYKEQRALDHAAAGDRGAGGGDRRADRGAGRTRTSMFATQGVRGEETGRGWTGRRNWKKAEKEERWARTWRRRRRGRFRDGPRSADGGKAADGIPAMPPLRVMVMVLWGLNFAVAKEGGWTRWARPRFKPDGALRFAVVATLLVPFVRLPRERIGALAGALSVTLGADPPLSRSCSRRLRFVDASVASITIQNPGAVRGPCWRRCSSRGTRGWGLATGPAAWSWRISGRRHPGRGAAGRGSEWVGRPDGGRRPAMVWAVANIQMKKTWRMSTASRSTADPGLFAAAPPKLAVASLLLEGGQVRGVGNGGLGVPGGRWPTSR